MIGSSPISLLAGAAVPLLALVVAGCGSGGSTNASTPSPPLRTADGSSPTVNGANTGLGATLVNSQGHTIYLFKKDTGTKSTCFGACASAWPPVRTSGKPTVGGGAKASLVGTTKRSDGKPQVTYKDTRSTSSRATSSPARSTARARRRSARRGSRCRHPVIRSRTRGAGHDSHTTRTSSRRGVHERPGARGLR